jgi:MFS transporter, DHA2 family, multidrug resistance protein
LLSNVLNVLVSFGSFILLSQYLQLVLGLSPLQAGLLSLPASLLAIAGPMLSPMLVQRIGTPLSVAGLLAIAALGFGVLTLVGGPLAAFTVALGWALWALGGSAAATLTTDTLIGSAPPERAGAVAALSQTGAELGGALGIATLGSLGTAIYRGMVASALPNGLPPELAATARDTLGGAVSVAGQLGDAEAAATLVLTAQHALTFALQVTSLIAAVVSIGTAVAAAVYLRERTDQKSRAPTERNMASARQPSPEPCAAACDRLGIPLHPDAQSGRVGRRGAQRRPAHPAPVQLR